MKWFRRILLFLLALLAGPLLMASCGDMNLANDWRTADRGSAGLAPDPASTPEAVVQVYAARAFHWRGLFAVHTWIAAKAEGAPHFKVHQVVGWRSWQGLPVVVSQPDLPDRNWYGNPPQIVAELRGPQAERAIAGIEEAVRTYPYPREYTLWPGPNSNTFVAHVLRHVPELEVDLPTTAIGKDFLTNGGIVASSPSGTGYQVSLYGLVGVLAARREGLEINLLGLSFGIDPFSPAIKLPGIGRLGYDRSSPKES